MSTQIAEYSPTAAAMAELRQKYEGTVYDVATTAGMAQTIAARREVREVRVNLEKLRKELKAPALERSRLIDAEAKDLTQQLEALEGPIDAQIKAEEQRKAEEKAERERVEREKLAALQARVADIRATAVKCVGETSNDIAGHIILLTQLEIDDTFGVLQGDAHTAKAETISTLRGMHTAALAQEDEAERLRIEREELEAQRKAQEEQAARDRADLARLRAEQEARERQAAEKARIEREAIEAERRKQEAAAAEARAAEEAKRAEEEAAAKAIRDAEEAELARQRAEIEAERRKVEAAQLAQEEAARKIQSGYEALEDFVHRFGTDPEFKIVATYIAKWLRGKNEVVA